MWKPVAARTISGMKATIEKLESLGLVVINGVISNVYLRDNLINMVISFDGDDVNDIFLRISGTELAKYHDCYLLTAIIDAINSVEITDFVTRAKLLKEANETIKGEFLDKTATITVQVLEPGDPIVQLDGSIYAEEATTDWEKYNLYEWK